MRGVSLWRGLVGLEQTAIEDVELEPVAAGRAGALVVHVRPMARRRGRCGVCRRRCPGYDDGAGRRRWRSLDQGTTVTFLEADAPRVDCAEHGVVVAHVPWARHGAGHTHAFDQQVAWLAVRTSKSAVCELMRVAWRTVGAIIERVWADFDAAVDRLAGLRRIGVDEVSYKRGQKFLMVVVDHDTGRLVWAAEGRTKATLRRFFDLLGEDRCAQITHVSADGAGWITEVAAERCPQAVRCADPFHVVKWANEALSRVRIDAWNEARALARTEPRLAGWAGHHQPTPGRDRARKLKGSRFALWKNPENLTDKQQTKLAWIATSDPRLYRAYLLKEGLRLIFRMPHDEAVPALDRWISWARRCRVPAFVDLARRIVNHKDQILAAIEHGLSNGPVESVNTKIRLLTRVAFGFKSAHALIALAMLNLGGYQPSLPRPILTHRSVRRVEI
ncbi:MAG TPA: ISL3 family transposase [Nocardioidaceae bacterium]|nr:ISL3 family transposase [Nocardioidaceae bacterium]